MGQHSNIPVIYCNDVPNLIERIKDTRRDEEDDLYMKLGIDGGGGFLKITLSIVSRNPSVAKDSFKESGVKRLHIIALAPNLPEKYEYISLLWNNLLKLNNLRYTVAGDLKIINVIVGIKAHSSSNPCPYCEVEKKDIMLQSAIPRTIGNIKDNCPKDVQPKRRNENNASCIHTPLISGDDDDLILEICPPPPLHIMLGIVNAVFQAVEKSYPDWADLWAHRANVRHQQRAYGFTGRACHSLISAAKILQDNDDLVDYFNVTI